MNRGKRDREVERNPESIPQFGLQAATRLHEVGIASNRRSAYCGEYVPGPCTVTPRKPFTPEAGVKSVEGRGGDWGEVVTR